MEKREREREREREKESESRERERQLVALLCLSTWRLVIVFILWLLLKVPWVGLQFEIVVFPDHTLLLFRVCK